MVENLSKLIVSLINHQLIITIITISLPTNKLKCYILNPSPANILLPELFLQAQFLFGFLHLCWLITDQLGSQIHQEICCNNLRECLTVGHGKAVKLKTQTPHASTLFGFARRGGLEHNKDILRGGIHLTSDV